MSKETKPLTTDTKENERHIKTAWCPRTYPAKHELAHKSPLPRQETLVLNYFTQYKTLYLYIYTIYRYTHKYLIKE